MPEWRRRTGCGSRGTADSAANWWPTWPSPSDSPGPERTTTSGAVPGPGLRASTSGLRRPGSVLLDAEPGQRVAVQAVARPPGHGPRPDGPVEAERGLVPIQHRPVDPGAALRPSLAGQRGQERGAHAAAAGLRSHVEVLEVDAEPARPRREIAEVDGHAEHGPVVVGHVGEDHGGLGEQGLGEQVLVDLHGVRLTLVGGQVADEADQRRDVVASGGTTSRRWSASSATWPPTSVSRTPWRSTSTCSPSPCSPSPPWSSPTWPTTTGPCSA